MILRSGARIALGTTALFGAACGRPPSSVTVSGQDAAGCAYVASLERGASLSVNVSCQGATGFRAEPGVARYVSQSTTRSGEPLDFVGDTLTLNAPGADLRYRVELGRMATELSDYNHALRVGNSIIAPGYSWMLSPVSVPDDLRVSVMVSGSSPDRRFVSGLAMDRDGYTLRANEIRVATFGIFGRFESDVIEMHGVNEVPSELEIVTLDGPLSVGPSVRRRWVLETSEAVSTFYGGFPVPRAMLAIVPVVGRAGVLHGKVLPQSDPGVAVLLGSDAGPEDLYADWILTHELFHLGFPSFLHEGKWLDEGLATYFEPLIRARKHWISEREVWTQFVEYMPRGLSVLERDGLEAPRNYRGMYWAGATVALFADVEARRHSQGARGLQQGLRALLRAGGQANHVWRLGDAIATIDAAMGAPALAPLARRYAKPGQHVPLGELFHELGVRERGGSVSLDDDAPLAAVRRAITRGAD